MKTATFFFVASILVLCSPFLFSHFQLQFNQSPNSSIKSKSDAIRSQADATQLIHKKIPALGNAYEQMNFRIEDAKARTSNKPRPTDPLTMAVLAGTTPPDIDMCNLPFSAITKAIFEQYLQEGMNYFQVANTIGFEGDEVDRTGSDVTYTWKDSDNGIAKVVFRNDKLYSKSQLSLKE